MIATRSKSSKPLDKSLIACTILGEPASKANSRRLVSMRGKPRFIKSKKALAYSEAFLLQCPVKKDLFSEDVFVAIKIYYASRRPDLDPSLILDLLQKRIYKNDRQVKIKYIEHGLDRTNPRSIIVIAKLEDKDLAIKELSNLDSI